MKKVKLNLDTNTRYLLGHFVRQMFNENQKSNQYDSRVVFTWIQNRMETSVTYDELIWLLEEFNLLYELTEAHPVLTEICKIEFHESSTEKFAMLTLSQICRCILYCHAPTPLDVFQVLELYHDYLKSLDKEITRLRKLPPVLPEFSSDSNWLAVYQIHQISNKTVEEEEERLRAQREREKADKTEKRIEKAFGASLEQQGIDVQYQVSCDTGIADIVTPDTIYEVKAYLTQSVMRKAIAQVMAYREAINPSAKIALVGYKHPKYPIDYKTAQVLDVEIIVWDDANIL